MSKGSKIKIIIANLFYPLFFILLLLSFFLIEGDYRFYLFAAWGVLPILILPLIKKKIDKTILFSFILSILFLISIFFSKQIPISIEKLLFYLISLSTFVFFRSLSKEAFSKKLFFFYLSIFSLTLNFFILFLTFFGSDLEIFSSMNLLIRNYGHNHYVAFLLLSIPAFWWQFLYASDERWASKKELSFLSAILLFSSYLLAIFSLGRVALLIVLLQLLIIFLLNKKSFLNNSKNFLAQIAAKSFILFFISITLIFLLLSISFSRNGESSCPLAFANKDLCKPILENDRFVYWQQGLMIFKDNPVFGVGLKNFNFATRKYLIGNQSLTSYAHNIFLHNLAETGVFVGGFFIFFILYLFYKSFLIVRKSENKQNLFLLIAASSSLLNAMFDFDWNFFVIFTLTLIYLAIILQDSESLSKNKNEKIHKIYFIIIFVISTFFAASYHIFSNLSSQQKYDHISKKMPYMSRQVSDLLSANKFNTLELKRLYPIYKNDPNFLLRYSNIKDLSPEESIDLKVKLAQIDPISFVKNADFDELDYQEAKILTDELMTIFQKNNFIDNTRVIDYWDQKNLAQQFYNFGNKAYFDGEVQIADDYYQYAFILNKYVMGNNAPAFLSETNFDKANSFLKEFKNFVPQDMGSNFYEYMSLHRKTLLYLFAENRIDDFFELSESIFKHEPNFSWFLFNELAGITDAPQEEQNLLLIYKKYKDLKTWDESLPQIEKIKTELAW